MDAFERTLAKSQQLAYIETVAAVLAQNERRDLPIDPSIVVEYEDIKKYLSSISRSKARFAVFDRGSCFTIVRLVDNFDLRSVYGEPGKKLKQTDEPKAKETLSDVAKIQQIDSGVKKQHLINIEENIALKLTEQGSSFYLSKEACEALTWEDIKQCLDKMSRGFFKFGVMQVGPMFSIVRLPTSRSLEEWYQIYPKPTAQTPESIADKEARLKWIEHQKGTNWE